MMSRRVWSLEEDEGKTRSGLTWQMDREVIGPEGMLGVASTLRPSKVRALAIRMGWLLWYLLGERGDGGGHEEEDGNTTMP